VPLFRSTDPLRKNDILASNLLFATLLLELGERLFLLALAFFYMHAEADALWARSEGWLLLAMLLKAAFYLAIRRGMFRAKAVVLLVCAYQAYTSTIFQYGYIVGVNFHDLWGYSLLVLLKDLLTLAALVLMFKKPRVAPSNTSYV
jgi:hypothetical protein